MRPVTYREAGVDLHEADRATARIKRLVQETFDERVLTGVGAFGASYALGGVKLRDPVLISSADGVGTKLTVAQLMGIHGTIGQDLVNHCVNDIAVQGARPLFFLDYFAAGKLEAETVAEVVAGLATACRENGVALIGGETAEMPGMYRPGDYDLAGFIVGAAERDELPDPDRIAPGDALLALPSTGLHTNGYSLARKLFFEVGKHSPVKKLPQLGATVGEELLRVHRSYLRPLRTLFDAGLLKGAAHITGGGITGNTPRMLPAGVQARISRGSWPVLPVFETLAELGTVAEEEMLRTFNMGLGLIVATARERSAEAIERLREIGETVYQVGEITAARSTSAKPRVVYA